jgi:hypothetical protein
MTLIGWPAFRALGTALRAGAGFPRADVENDFLRARQRQVASRLVNWVRRSLIISQEPAGIRRKVGPTRQ